MSVQDAQTAQHGFGAKVAGEGVETRLANLLDLLPSLALARAKGGALHQGSLWRLWSGIARSKPPQIMAAGAPLDDCPAAAPMATERGDHGLGGAEQWRRRTP